MKTLFKSLLPRTISVHERSKADSRVRYKPTLQVLEDRLTPACSFLLSGGILTINGTGVADTVMISASGTHLLIDHRSAGDTTTAHQPYPLTSVSSMVFNGYAGDDRLTNTSNRRMTADGGEGNDTLTDGSAASTLRGGAGVDSLRGGPGNDVIYGGAGNDMLYGEGGTDRLYGEDHADSLFGGDSADTLLGGYGDDALYGDTGADLLFGNAGNDQLRGGNDNDTLYGGSGDDKLWGNAGSDRLYGETGNDFCDAGSASEYAHGGLGSLTVPENNFNPYILAINSARFTDVYQGGGPTCWIDAAISSVASKGVDLASRITYLGNNMFRVGLYNFTRDTRVLVWTTEDIYFDGSLFPSGDVRPNPLEKSANGFRESWVIITQRAILQAISRWDPTQSIANPHSGGATEPLSMLTGRAASWNAPNATQISNALRDGKNVVLDSPNPLPAGASPKLVPWHQYNVIDMTANGTSWNIRVRNPWGRDGGAVASNNPDDGWITLTWSEVINSNMLVAIC